MSDIPDRLKRLYKKMYDLTNPLCGKCSVPNSCCSAAYCYFAKEHAKEFWDVDLEIPEEPYITKSGRAVPFLSEKGCTIEPHLRPLCTLHHCDVSSFGFLKDPKDNKKYWRIRDKIVGFEFKMKRNTLEK